MSEFEQGAVGTLTEETPRNHRFRRGIYLLPSVMTAGNILCGYYAVISTLRGSVVDMDNAAKAIGFAFLFDSLDGLVARATRTNSEFGKQFDSLADVISFGIAPAFLAFAWGVRGLASSDSSAAHIIVELGWIICFAFLICCAWRLARFNVHGMAPGGRYFVGLATPAAAGTIAAVVHAFWSPIQSWPLAALWLVVVLGLSILMVSSVRYFTVKEIKLRRRVPSVAIVVVCLLVAAIVFYSELTLLLIAGLYVLSGIVLHVIRSLRHRTSGHPASRPA
jgi:CDP-diacylglycerol---serine O-phosphatidyltransferase